MSGNINLILLIYHEYKKQIFISVQINERNLAASQPFQLLLLLLLPVYLKRLFYDILFDFCILHYCMVATNIISFHLTSINLWSEHLEIKLSRGALKSRRNTNTIPHKTWKTTYHENIKTLTEKIDKLKNSYRPGLHSNWRQKLN